MLTIADAPNKQIVSHYFVVLVDGALSHYNDVTWSPEVAGRILGKLPPSHFSFLNKQGRQKVGGGIILPLIFCSSR
jgi:hypothetical protein